mmetsp:Transcript_18351/g.35939  ORF Transcript_18351/g.35939 Transcript_18351/m.35939 type:complete len:91 (-) Transcript_18351:78-350(-)
MLKQGTDALKQVGENEIRFVCMDHDTFQTPGFLGCASLQLDEIAALENRCFKGWLPLNGVSSGEIWVEVRLCSKANQSHSENSKRSHSLA